MKKSKSNLIYSIICLMLVGFCCILGATGAYFKFSKFFSSSGDLPILKIQGSASSANEFVRISSDGVISTQYTGGEVDLNVKISTKGNNINGYVRVFVLISWQNGLSNVQSGEKICDFVFDSEIWEIKNNGTGSYYYLKSGETLAPDQEVQLFTKIKFNEEHSDTYYGKTVEIVIVPDIHQTVNLPANW